MLLIFACLCAAKVLMTIQILGNTLERFPIDSQLSPKMLGRFSAGNKGGVNPPKPLKTDGLTRYAMWRSAIPG